ncbi:MAG: pyridoxal phosphate-dependent aminotransferase [Acidobacteriota bacterium]
MKFSSRVAGISASATLAVMEQAQRLRRQGIDVIDLGPGEPDFATPQAIKEAGIEAIDRDFTKYTAATGILELREAVAERYNRRWGTDFSAANVAITCGAKHAIFEVCMALFEGGDEVLIPSPYWVTFPEIVKMADASPRIVVTGQENGFLLDPVGVDSRLTSSTRGLLINTPNNPTGAVLPQVTLNQIVELSRRQGLFLLCDETYEFFVYEDSSPASLAASVRADDDFFAIVGSVSKTYAMTGWRIGYCVGHRRLIDRLRAFQSHQTGNPTSISQKAALAALRGEPAEIETMRREYQKRRELVVALLAKIPGFECVPPKGAFYAFPNVSRALRATGMSNSEEFSRFLIEEARVATVPGVAFGAEGYIRISYATSFQNLQEGLSRIRAVVERAMAKP